MRMRINRDENDELRIKNEELIHENCRVVVETQCIASPNNTAIG